MKRRRRVREMEVQKVLRQLTEDDIKGCFNFYPPGVPCTSHQRLEDELVKLAAEIPILHGLIRSIAGATINGDLPSEIAGRMVLNTIIQIYKKDKDAHIEKIMNGGG